MVQCKISIEFITRFLALGVGIFVAVISVLTIITFSILDLSAFIMAFYYLLFAIVLVLSQFDVQFILKNFQLLRFPLGKSLYCLLLGIIMLNSKGLQLGCAITLVVFGLYHVIIYFIPSAKITQKTDQSKIQDLSARDKPLTS